MNNEEFSIEALKNALATLKDCWEVYIQNVMIHHMNIILKKRENCCRLYRNLLLMRNF